MIKAIVTDIEGTTSSLSFVQKTLFPYAEQHLPDFVRAYEDEPEVSAILEKARVEAGDSKLELDALIDTMLSWIAQDLKVTPLKALQGLIWQSGYSNGDFTGHIYPDAVAVLQGWQQQGLSLYVYSSGSVQAQKLLFGHTEFGDLTQLFAGYFDTRVGGKKEAASYKNIQAQIGFGSASILFLSDVVAELDAAALAGWQTLQLVRPGESQPAGQHQTAKDFSSIKL